MEDIATRRACLEPYAQVLIISKVFLDTIGERTDFPLTMGSLINLITVQRNKLKRTGITCLAHAEPVKLDDHPGKEIFKQHNFNDTAGIYMTQVNVKLKDGSVHKELFMMRMHDSTMETCAEMEETIRKSSRTIEA